MENKDYDHSFKVYFDTYAFDFALTVMAVSAVGLLALYFIS